MKKVYRSFKEIEQDLRTFNLQRQIAMEEMKLLKIELKEDLQPYQWLSTALSTIKKYGVLYLIRRLFK
ncbi:DUF6327 family protein [Aquimarina muelleri]|uniref:Glutaminyl-tRNA synthetase n=1 Tax=Aquimarina muelleri TaxID=279356 RepID=A0A918K001_9FLAO|nr:DUF6327 family protein [Aquimarina muelleri]MCX2764747.1 DUF6327 family protein [Aquimarina muelleri]GGX33532.1 hypothetical protein GCM10007384_37760 [Aquimarina muelleri]